MHLEPSIHATAILEGFKSEKVSLLVETLLEHRASSFPTHRRNYDLEYQKKLKYGFKEQGSGY